MTRTLRPRPRSLAPLVCLVALLVLGAARAGAVTAPNISGPTGLINVVPTYMITGDANCLTCSVSWTVTGPAGYPGLPGTGTTAAVGAVTPTPDGGYTVTGTQTDNVDPLNPVAATASLQFTLDLTRPLPPIIQSPLSTPTKSGAVTWTGPADAVSYAAKIDNGPAFVASNPITVTGDGQHTVEIVSKDAAGNLSDPATVQFFLDTQPPVPGAILVPPYVNAASNPTKPLTVLPASDPLPSSGPLSYTLAPGSYSLPGPDGPKTITVTVTDPAGNSAAASATTILDTAAPGLTTISPARDQIGVGPLAPIQVTFSEPVLPQPLTGANVQIVCPGCPPAPATVTPSTVPGVNALTIQPTQPLLPGTRYEVQFSGITDVAGNPLLVPSRWFFTTGNDTTPPPPVSALSASGGVELATLRWKPPVSADVAKIRVLRRDGTAPTGAADPSAVVADLGARADNYTDTGLIAGHTYFYALYAFDAAGNPSQTAATASATAQARPASPPPLSPTVISGGSTAKRVTARGPLTLNARLLRPVAGKVLRTLTPMLQWKRVRGPRMIYNLQIFTAGGHKRLSVFPSTNSFRVPAHVLRPGKRYIWRVWPYPNRKPAKRALGISFFNVPKSLATRR